LAKRYHNLQRWNHWLTKSRGGQLLLAEEQRVLSTMLAPSIFNKHAILIGVPTQKSLLTETNTLHQIIISALANRGVMQMQYIEADLEELPILSGQVDLVLLPHTLEWVEHPRQLLAEACRIVRPEGLIVIFGFNPHSLFRLTQLWEKKQGIPWSADFQPVSELKKWMQLAGFQIESSYSFLYRPLSKYAYLFDHFPVCEYIGKHIFPYYGGVYALLARAKEIPLTPIKMQWKQQLSAVRISSVISGHTITDGIK
jgi:SAM-dependent methyltransferase